jgi:putative membrane protein
MRLLLAWAINALVLLALSWVLPGIHVSGAGGALLAALALALLNTLIRPVLLVLTLPINLLTLGLFTLVINGFLFWLASRLIDGFRVDGFWWAVLGAIAYSLASSLVGRLVHRGR